MIKTGYILGFRDVFPNETVKSLISYLDGIPKSIALDILTALLGQNAIDSKYSEINSLLSMWFCSENYDIKEYILSRCIRTRNEKHVDVQVVNPYTSLQLFQFIYEMNESAGSYSQSNIEIEINIFKAYLLINQRNDEREEGIAKGVNLPDGYEKVSAIMFTQSFRYFELVNYNCFEVFACQMFRSIYLFEFLESYTPTQHLLEKFLSIYNIADWKYYLKSILGISYSVLKKQNESYLELTVPKDDAYEKNKIFLEKFILSESDDILDYDFKMIRDKPLLKIKEGKYRIVYDLFFLEKISKGLYFDLSKFNKNLGSKLQVKDFRRVFTFEYSEKYLLYNTLQRIFGTNYNQLTGESFENSKFDGGPDYYIRNGNKILIFESKDVLINAEVKQSFDYESIIAEVKKKLYYYEDNGAIVKAAIKQQISVVEKILSGKFSPDPGINPTDVKIYPLIVVHDRTTCVMGINSILHKWFQDELDLLSQEGLDVSGVRLTNLVDIDTLLYSSESLQQHNNEVYSIIDAYNEKSVFDTTIVYESIEHAIPVIQDCLKPFSFYFIDHLNSLGLFKFPKSFFKEKGYSLFEEIGDDAWVAGSNKNCA